MIFSHLFISFEHNYLSMFKCTFVNVLDNNYQSNYSDLERQRIPFDHKVNCSNVEVSENKINFSAM